MPLTEEHTRGLELARSGRLDEAETVFQSLLDADSTDSEALHFFGVLAGRKGDLPAAEQYFRRALDARQDWAKAWNSLGKVCQAQGRLPDAEIALQNAVKLRPIEVQYYCDLGMFLRENDRLADAAAVLRKATQAEPNSADALVYLAAVLKDLAQNTEAEAACQRATSIAPDHAEAHNILGLVQRRLGKYADAEANFRQAIALTPESPEACPYLCNLANLLRNMGKFDEAEAEYRRAVEIDPSYTQSFRQLAMLGKIKAGDPLCMQMEELVRSPQTAPRQRIDLHFGLANILDRGRDYDSAFGHWNEGNRLKRSTLKYDDASREEVARQTIAAFDDTLMSRLGDLGNPSDAPIFILGMPRSGTTLVEQILASHSSVTAAGELPFLGRLAAAANFPAGAGTWDEAGLRQMADIYLTEAQPDGSLRFTDKMPSNYLYVGLIRLILPNARIIHCRRNAADTCLSCFQQQFTDKGQPWSYDLHELGLQYRRYERLMEHWQSIAPGAMHEVRYETLIENQEAETRRLLEVCGLAFEEACLRPHETERPVETASATQVRQPVYRTSQGRWRNYESHLTPLLGMLNNELG